MKVVQGLSNKLFMTFPVISEKTNNLSFIGLIEDSAENRCHYLYNKGNKIDCHSNLVTKHSERTIIFDENNSTTYSCTL